MGVSKVSLGNEVLMDITDTTATEDTVAEGVVVYGADGEKITGEVKHRIFKGEVTTTIKGASAYVDLLKDTIFAEHFNDPNFWVKVTFDVEPTAYTVKENWAFNTGVSTNLDIRTRTGQHVYRYDANSANSMNNMSAPLKDKNSGTFGVGGLVILEDGTLRMFSASNSYAIRPSKFTVEVNWNA